ncbi:unnamed protein product [Miscanthus lutarioriparius]|uniref:RING-type domain-containing protein n=1 Tax=Miscanthus lutarioriparius TaxID=422564 RepID=A0A811QXM4_9POAL|nr:unnamed protein product [Miscanthus lutarioriparius]
MAKSSNGAAPARLLDAWTTEAGHGPRLEESTTVSSLALAFHACSRQIVNCSEHQTEKTRCDLCERLVTKRSPWGSCRIVRTGDLPVAGVLPCSHVYHAECLEWTTPKGQKHDPPCPVCEKLAGKDTEQWSICRLKNGF